MSVIDSTPEQICHSLTNKSKAKMLYSFPRSSRFPQGKENQCDRFYEIDKKNNQRATNLGYGTKYDFTKEQIFAQSSFPKTPAPGSYQTDTTFEQSKKKNKGFGFGSGRGQMEATGFIKKNTNPGPGEYSFSNQRNNIYYSLKGKGKTDNRQQTYQPGPGTYETISNLSPAGRLFSSRFKNRSAIRFGKEQRLKCTDRKVPGPGDYDSSKTQFSPQGKYFYSRLQSAKNSRFGKQKKLSSTNRCQTPGPGSYRLPSQFGYYLNKESFNQSNGLMASQF